MEKLENAAFVTTSRELFYTEKIPFLMMLMHARAHDKNCAKKIASELTVGHAGLQFFKKLATRRATNAGWQFG